MTFSKPLHKVCGMVTLGHLLLEDANHTQTRMICRGWLLCTQ
jgi:hypothetical protein